MAVGREVGMGHDDKRGWNEKWNWDNAGRRIRLMFITELKRRTNTMGREMSTYR